MKDLKLDAAGDLDVSAFDLSFATEDVQLAQRIRIKLRTFLGEVPLNLEAGVPWFENILGVKPLDVNRVEAILREQILTTPEVESIEGFAMDFDPETRGLTVTVKIISNYGPLSITAEAPEDL